MKTKLKNMAIIIIASAILLSCNYKAYIFTALIANSFSYEGPYTYMSTDGSIKTTIVDGGESHEMYELLGAIEAKYGLPVAQTYLACAQSGDYSAYYASIGKTKTTFHEHFKYSTNGMTMQKFGPMGVEETLSWVGVTKVSDLIAAANNAGYSDTYEYAGAVLTGKVAKPTTTAPQPAKEQPKTDEPAPAQPESNPATTSQPNSDKKAEPKNEPEKKKEISHGLYDDISDKAESALTELLSDGVDDSCYVQIKADAEDRTISASVASKTASNKENGKIEFYNKGENDDYSEFSYSVTFPQIEVKDDVDLAATYAALDTSKYENVYQFAFITEQTLPSEVEITLNVSGTSGDKYYLLRGKDDNDYNTFATADCDDKGYITFKTNQLDNIIVSKSDIVSIREAEKKAEQEAIEKEVKPEEALTAASTESSTEQIDEINAENSKVSAVMLVIAGIVAIILIVAGVMIYRKNR